MIQALVKMRHKSPHQEWTLSNFRLAQTACIWQKPGMQLFVGLGAHRGGIKRYPFDILELPVSPSLPKPKTLKEMKVDRSDLTFSLRLHPDVIHGGCAHPDIERACIARDILGVPVVVIPTGPRFTPTENNRTQLRALVEKLRSDTCRVAWEPRGVFAPREVERWATEIGALLVRDLTREAAYHEGIVYTRLLGLGFGARVSQDATEILASQIESAELAYVIVGGDGAKMTRTRLRELLDLGDSVEDSMEESTCDDT